MTLKEKKRKLSEILGINLFEARYKEIDALLEETIESAAAPESENPEEQAAETETEEVAGAENNEGSESQETQEEDTETPLTDGESASEEASAESGGEEETATETNSETAETQSSSNNELFDAKLEAKLLRANVREDKLDAAKKLFKADYSIADIEIVDKFIKDYPEWIKQKTIVEAKGFGMDVGETDDGETPEEKRLRELGIA